MHTHASNSELVEPLPEPERTLNRRLCQRNRRVPFEKRNNPPQHPRIVYPPILDINYFRHFLDILRNYDPMDDEPMWAADRVVALTLSFAITIPKTANKFTIKALFDRLLGEIRAFSQHENESLTDAWLRIKEMLRNCHGHNLSKGNIIKIFYHGLNEITQEVLNVAAGGVFLYKTPNQTYQLLKDKVSLKLDWAKNQKTKSSFKKTIAFAAEGSSNSDTDKIMARMDAITMKIDAQYKDFQSRSKQSNLDDDDIPMSLIPTAITGVQAEEAITTETTINLTGSLPSNTQPNPKGSSSKPYQPTQDRNEHVNAVFTRSGKCYDLPDNLNDQQNNSETPINFDSDDEDDEPTPQPKSKTPTPVKETPKPKPYKPKIPYPQRLKKEKIKAQYGKFLDMIRAVRINVPLVDVLARMPNYGKFLKELPIDHSNTLLEILKRNLLIEFGKFTFPVDFIILEMEEDSKVPLILGSPFLHTSHVVIQVKQKQLNLRVGTERMTFSIDFMMKHSYSNNDTCFSIDVIDKILEEDFDALLDERSEIFHSIKGTILKEKLFAEFDEFMAINIKENSESESETKELPFKKITFNTEYKIKAYLEEPHLDLELKPLPGHLEYVFLEEPNFLPVIISSQLSKQNCNKLISILKRHKQSFAWKTTDILGICSIRRSILENNFSVFGNSIDNCLNNLDKMHQRCKDANLVLNSEKCHFKIKVKKSTENVVADHLSRIDNDEASDDSNVDDNFPRETVIELRTKDIPWFADFAN
ncbi:reverse transcriptase domain-containing protein [Tanacetum coccineum]